MVKDSGSKMKQIFFYVLLAFIIIVSSFLLLEGAYRIYKIKVYGMVAYPDTHSLGIFKSDDIYGAVPAKGFSSDNLSADIRKHPNVQGFDKSFSFNSKGYRGREFLVQKEPHVFRIVAFGGSTTMSKMSDDDKTWCARLEKMLDEDSNFKFKLNVNKVEVINAGVGGWRTREGLLRLKNEVQQFEPDLLLVAFNWNDLYAGVQGHDPNKRKVNKKRWWLNFALMENAYVRFLVHKSHSNEKFIKYTEGLKLDTDYTEVFRDNIINMHNIASKINAEMALVNLPGLCRDVSVKSYEYDIILKRTRVTDASFPFFYKLKKFISTLLNGISNDIGVDFIDVSSGFNSFSEEKRLELFVDEMHFTEKGSDEVAKYIYGFLSN